MLTDQIRKQFARVSKIRGRHREDEVEFIDHAGRRQRSYLLLALETARDFWLLCISLRVHGVYEHGNGNG